MGHGGKRAGAGRKKGSLGLKARTLGRLAERAEREGRDILAVLLQEMRNHGKAGRYDKAGLLAGLALSWCHRRLRARGGP